jgi:hypothetical protein
MLLPSILFQVSIFNSQYAAPECLMSQQPLGAISALFTMHLTHRISEINKVLFSENLSQRTILPVSMG